MLASGSYDTTVVVWDMETFAPKLTLKVFYYTTQFCLLVGEN